MFDQSSSDPPDKDVKTLFQQINQSQWFTRVLERVKTLQTLQAIFDQECPAVLIGKCQVIEIKQSCLYVNVENASVATQLQYYTRELVVALNKYPTFADLKKIRVRIDTALRA